jgi:TolB protein
VAFTSGDGVSNGIAIINADGTQHRLLVPPGESRDQPHAGTESPRQSPHGRVVFSSNRAGGPDDWHIFAVSESGGEPVQITAGADGIEYHPAMSPDGRALAYGKAVATPGGPEPFRDAGIFVSDPDGAGERQLTTAPEGAADEWPDFSPDGRSIAFTRARSDEGGLFVIGLDGQGLTRLVDAELQPYRPRWSPDGSMIVFSSNADRASARSANVWVVGADGSGLRQLTQATGSEQAWAPDWSPDGIRIVFVHQQARAETTDLEVIGADGSPGCTLFSGSASTSAWDPDWALAADR